jgi:hypothetical protein
VKITETRTRPESTYEQQLCLECDICHRRSPRACGWSKNWHGVNTVTVQREEGVRYPDGCDLKTETWDLCPQCFDKHVRQPLKVLGAIPRTEEVTT